MLRIHSLLLLAVGLRKGPQNSDSQVPWTVTQLPKDVWWTCLWKLLGSVLILFRRAGSGEFDSKVPGRRCFSKVINVARAF